MAKGPQLLVAVLLVAALALAGCVEPIKTYTRSTDSEEEFFLFNVPERTREIIIEFSVEEGTGGSVDLVVVELASGGENIVYFGSLPAGERVRETITSPKEGSYGAVLQYNDYEGPATVVVSAAQGGVSIGPIDGFWDMLGILITLSVAGGGFVVYRRHTKRLDREMARIDETFERLQDDVTQCRVELHNMQEELRRRLVQNKLRESHFLILEKRIDRYLENLRGHSRSREDETPLTIE